MTSQLNKIADYWNQRSFGYSLDNQEELLHDQEKWIELINRYLKINKGMKVLDLGCGPGFFSVMLTNLGCQVIGIDYSDKMLEEARNNARKFKANVEFQKMDFCEYICSLDSDPLKAIFANLKEIIDMLATLFQNT